MRLLLLVPRQDWYRVSDAYDVHVLVPQLFILPTNSHHVHLVHYSPFVSAGEGTWTFNTTEPILQALATSIGIEFTPETCAETYAKTWNDAHQGKE